MKKEIVDEILNNKDEIIYIRDNSKPDPNFQDKTINKKMLTIQEQCRKFKENRKLQDIKIFKGTLK